MDESVSLGMPHVSRSPCSCTCLVEELRFATTYLARVRGLFAHPNFSGCLVLVPCRSIHTFGMKECIQVAFFDERGCILEADRCVEPCSFRSNRFASGVIERRLPVNNKQCLTCTCSWFSPGDVIELFCTSEKGINNE